MVEEWVASNFKPLTNISGKTPPEVGEHVFWRGLKTGRSGNPSTKCEFFNGKVRQIEVNAEGEVYIYLD